MLWDFFLRFPSFNFFCKVFSFELETLFKMMNQCIIGLPMWDQFPLPAYGVLLFYLINFSS